MRMKIYDFLVNRHSGIRERYHRLHDNADQKGRIYSYAKLLEMNAEYYILRKKDLDMPANISVYEDRHVPLNISESAKAAQVMGSVDKFIQKLSGSDVVSFDIFDTLIFRPFSEPVDIFFIMGERLGFLDFKRIRIEQEFLSRKDKKQTHDTNEVTLQDIWNRMEKETGIPADLGIKTELETEREFCFANPFMKKIYDIVKEEGKQIVITSDIYLPGEFLKEILEKNGFTGFEKLYVSCEYGCSKSDGGLYRKIKNDYPHKKIIHVGDNKISDSERAKEAGHDVLFYPNADKEAFNSRSYDLSPMIGGAYRGVVNKRLYSGIGRYSMEYEYGYIYGGLFVLGYCGFIHRYYKDYNIDKLLFLARDGDILKQVYEKLFPGDNVSYLYWSRAVGTKLMIKENRYDYYKRYIFNKVNQSVTIEKVLESMGIKFLSETDDWKKTGLNTSDKLTHRNSCRLKSFLNDRFDEIVKAYEPERKGAYKYIKSELDGCKKACAVDVGWAGSGAIALDTLCKNEWDIDCDITGIIAGTNTIHNAEPDASESFLQTGRLVPYMYSQSLNRDLLKKHDPNRYFNVFWELLLSSPSKQLTGFGINENGETVFNFGKEDANQEGIRKIQKGIKDFVADYVHHFRSVPYMFNISGRDAYAPLLAVAGKDNKYLQTVAGKFDLMIGVE